MYIMEITKPVLLLVEILLCEKLAQSFRLHMVLPMRKDVRVWMEARVREWLRG